MQEIFRVLSPGGNVILSAPTSITEFDREKMGHIRCYNRESVYELLTSFRDIKIESFTVFFGRLEKIIENILKMLYFKSTNIDPLNSAITSERRYTMVAKKILTEVILLDRLLRNLDGKEMLVFARK
jgi:hypothetical protein